MNTRAPRASRAARAIATTTLAIALVACSNDQELADITTIAPPVTQPTTTAAPATTAATETTEPAADTTVEVTAPETTASETTAATDPGITGPMFSDALGVKVDTAPGVNTPGDTRQLLPEGLYVHIAWQADPNDPSVFTARPDDIEILEAYANASTAYYEAVISDRTTDAPEFDEFFLDGGAKYDRNFAEAREGGYIGSLGAGVVLRPYVLPDETSGQSAVVLDCYLQDEEYVLEGQPVEPGPLEPRGTIATLKSIGGRWIVDLIAEEPTACL